jgi:hypothetical protein
MPMLAVHDAMLGPFGTCSSSSNSDVATLVALDVRELQPCVAPTAVPSRPGAKTMKLGHPPPVSDGWESTCRWSVQVQATGQTEGEVV